MHEIPIVVRPLCHGWFWIRSQCVECVQRKTPRNLDLLQEIEFEEVKSTFEICNPVLDSE